MAIQCADIETLVQTYLDGELAESDASALQDHLDECTTCNQFATEEARFHARLRERLAPPPAPDHLRGNIMKALDQEDWRLRKQRSSRWNWTLPAASSLAAAAALLFFVVSSNQAPRSAPVADDAARQHLRRPPIEVAGSSVKPWVREHLSPVAHVPRFSSTNTNLRGARLSHLLGHDAIRLFYTTRVEHRLYDVTVMLLDASALELCIGRKYRIGGRKLCVAQKRGLHIVTHEDGDGLGYVFISEMDADKMLQFVSTSDLLLRAPENGR